MASIENLKRLTSAEARIQGEKGGIASGKARREKRDMQKMAQMMLERVLTGQQIDRTLGEQAESLIGEDRTAMAVMIGKQILEACEGNTKAFETLRDTAGYKPKDQLEVAADIMTEADRALVNKVSKRLEKEEK